MPINGQSFIPDEPPKPPELLRRRGRFLIGFALVETSPQAFIAALSGVGVVRAEAMWSGNGIEYTGMCRDFEPVEPGSIPPLYECIITQHRDEETGEVTFTREYRRERLPPPPEPELPAGMVAVPRETLRFVLDNADLWGGHESDDEFNWAEMKKHVEILQDAAPPF